MKYTRKTLFEDNVFYYVSGLEEKHQVVKVYHCKKVYGSLKSYFM